MSTNPGAPLCPKCHTVLTRVRRRFVDRLISLFYPVHRYRCRSFGCTWEGSLPCSRSERSEKAARYYNDNAQAATAMRNNESEARSVPVAPPLRQKADSRPLEPTDPVPREGDTLPMPSPTKAGNASAGSQDGTKSPRRAKERAKAVPR